MIVTAALLGIATLISVAAPRMSGTAWGQRAPRLAVFAWQSASLTVIATTVLAGLTMLVASTPLSGGLAEVFHACVLTIRSAYDSPGHLLGVVLGLGLSVALPARVAWCLAATGVHGWRRRRQLRRLIAVVARPDAALGVSIVEAESAAAAFCLAGKGGTIVLTTAAVRSLNVRELDAVLAHERAHLRGRHDIAVGAAHALARALPFAPMFGVAAAEIGELVELIADDCAAGKVDRLEVASALVTLAGMTAPAIALPAAQGATAARVSRLLQPGRPLRPVHTALGVALGILALAVPLAVAAIPLIAALASGLCTVPNIAIG
ncbi:MAG: M56 family metallopeptidase [Pseudonocardiales bacterium]|nr:M56 family metallopeptidase [Pseudonocardiales bacterium]